MSSFILPFTLKENQNDDKEGFVVSITTYFVAVNCLANSSMSLEITDDLSYEKRSTKKRRAERLKFNTSPLFCAHGSVNKE